jgi:aspartate/methionine/tyrosine aminotransferase
MKFDPANKFPSITKIAQDQDYKDFAVIFTGSKTYGLERARFGLIMFGDEQLAKKARNNLGKAVGSIKRSTI